MTRFVLIWLLLLTLPLLAGDTEEPYLVKTKDFHVTSFSLTEIGLGITAVIYNPYKAKVNIEEILIDVYVQDKKLGVILEAAKKVEIPKRSAFDLPLEMLVRTGPALAKFGTETVRLALGKTVKVDFKGYIKVRALGFVPIKVKVDETQYFTSADIFPDKKSPKTDSLPAGKP